MSFGPLVKEIGTATPASAMHCDPGVRLVTGGPGVDRRSRSDLGTYQ